MLNDGATLGADAETAMRGILGDDDALARVNAGEERKTPEEMELWLRETQNPDTYGGAANVLAVGFIDLMRERPETATWDINRRYVYRDRETGQEFAREELPREAHPYDYEVVPIGRDLWGALKAHAEALKAHAEAHDDTRLLEAMSDATGFMVGWAVNAAKYVVGQPPVANPALMTAAAR